MAIHHKRLPTPTNINFTKIKFLTITTYSAKARLHKNGIHSTKDIFFPGLSTKINYIVCFKWL